MSLERGLFIYRSCPEEGGLVMTLTPQVQKLLLYARGITMKTGEACRKQNLILVISVVLLFLLLRFDERFA